MTERYICYIKREDRMEEPKTITVTENELIAIIEEGREVQGYRMSQIEMITTKEEDNKEWLLPRAFKKESGEHIPNGYNIYITEKEVEKISEDEARIREILKDPSSVFVGLSAEGLHVWINQAKKYYIEPELNRINRIQY
jgi:hypothetical protein